MKSRFIFFLSFFLPLLLVFFIFFVLVLSTLGFKFSFYIEILDITLLSSLNFIYIKVHPKKRGWNLRRFIEVCPFIQSICMLKIVRLSYFYMFVRL